MSQYDREYYENGIESGKSLYSNFRWIPELTIPLAHQIMKCAGITENDRVLDFGCAKGFLVKALRLLHVNAFGVDVSQYALSQAPEDTREFLFASHQFQIAFEEDRWDVVIAKDVFEHMTVVELHECLSWFRDRALKIFVMVPLGHSGSYHIQAYELDKTHVIREELSWWKSLLESYGYKVDARYRWGHIKENWVNANAFGNGFLLATK